MKTGMGNETRLIQRIGRTDFRGICLGITGESLKTRTKSSKIHLFLEN